MPYPKGMAKALREPLLKIFPPVLLGRLVAISGKWGADHVFNFFLQPMEHIDMTLNEELTWAEVGDISTGGAGKVRDAFQLMFGNPTKELLPAGTLLYKFNGFSALGQGVITDAMKLSPWWSPINSFKHDAGLTQRMLIAEKNGVTFREWGRLTSVIKENWSSLNWLLTIELKVPMYAWFGGFKGMSRIDAGAQSRRNIAVEKKGGSNKLPGGGTQFYIPNMRVGHLNSHSFKPL
jgi:hypothetical protein